MQKTLFNQQIEYSKYSKHALNRSFIAALSTPLLHIIRFMFRNACCQGLSTIYSDISRVPEPLVYILKHDAE